MSALEWNVAEQALPGEERSGDRAVVTFANQHALAAVVDGLGHGPEAAAAAEAASKVLERSAQRDVIATVNECHRALRSTRGAALSAAVFDCRTHALTWVGIGNVEARLLRGARPVPMAESLLLHRGIVGHELSQLSARTTAIRRGDVLILATDGIQPRFADSLVPNGSCREIADQILNNYASGHDDALVLVVRYLDGVA